MMTKEEVLSILKTHPNGNIEESNFKKKFPELYQEFISWSFPDDFKFTQKLFHYFNDDPELKLGLCPVCGKRCKFKTFITGYCEHCSLKCINNDKMVREKIENTNLERYGNKNNLWSESGRKKVLDTCIKHWGVDNVLKSDVIKEKIKQTTIERYGCEHNSQCNEIKEKKKKTSLSHFGVEYPNQSKEIINKRIETNLHRYGCICTLTNIDIIKKSYNTKLERYGDGDYVNVEKIKKTKLERYGDENYNNSVKISKSLLSKDVQQKMYETRKKNKSFNTSKIENEIEKYFKDNDIEFIHQYKSDLYPFNCDFYLPEYDLYIEIQGTWTHGKHPFNQYDEDDLKTLDIWNEKSKESNYYKTAIEVWTHSDVNKREVARRHNLNYLEIYSIKLNVIVKKIKERMCV